MKLLGYKCNYCGNKFGKEDCCDNSFSISHKFGYESKYDGGTLEIDLCPTCADRLTGDIIKSSQIKCIGI